MGVCLAAIAGLAMGEGLSLSPPAPGPLDTVRLVYTHVGCTNPDSVRVAQQSNRITVQADRVAFVDCGTVAGYFDEYTLGRLPSGDYDVELVVNPPPPTLGPSMLVGSVHLTVAPLPATGSLHPHDDYTDIWWNPAESGWSLSVKQSAEKLFLAWNTYDASNRATWFVLPAGAWSRDSAGVLHFSGAVYRVIGPGWQGAFDPAAVKATAVGTADFALFGVRHALFTYTIDGISGSKPVERLRF